MIDENNQYLPMLVFALVFFFIGGLKLYQGDLLTAIILLAASILIVLSYLLVNYDFDR